MSKHQAINRFGVSSNPAFSQFQKINVSTISFSNLLIPSKLISNERYNPKTSKPRINEK